MTNKDKQKCDCKKQSTRTCKETPNGGWGTMKCGAPLCDDCKCDCTDILIH